MSCPPCTVAAVSFRGTTMFKPNLAIEPDGAVFFPKYASAKLDGIRCATVEGSALTRSLKPIPNNHIRKLLAPYQGLDGEIIVGSPTAPDVYRTTNSAVMSHDGTPQPTYFVFDLVNNPGTYEQRLQELRTLVLPDFIQVLDQRQIHTQDELDTYYNDLLEQGYEGAILRNPAAKYKHGRATAKSQDMLKCKPYADSDAVILSTYEAMFNGNEAFTNELGRTERSTAASGLTGKGMIGGFLVRDVHSGVEFHCSAGTLTHSERTELMKVDCVGRILKYRHMPYGVMTNNKPRFPRFIGWRDKSDM